MDVDPDTRIVFGYVKSFLDTKICKSKSYAFSILVVISILFLLVTEETLHTQQHSLSDHALPSYVDRSALVIYFSWTLYIGREKGAKISALQAGIVTRLPRRHLHVRQSYRQLHGSEHIPLGAPACKPNLHVAACVRACILYNIAA